MRDERRRQGNKRTHGVLRAEQRRKKSNKRRKRHEIRDTTPNKEAFTERQLGECEGAVVVTKPKLIRPTTAELERDVLQEENEKMQKYTRFLLWRINEQERKAKQEMETLVKVHQGQARHIRRVEDKLRKAQAKLRIELARRDRMRSRFPVTLAQLDDEDKKWDNMDPTNPFTYRYANSHEYRQECWAAQKSCDRSRGPTAKDIKELAGVAC